MQKLWGVNPGVFAMVCGVVRRFISLPLIFGLLFLAVWGEMDYWSQLASNLVSRFGHSSDVYIHIDLNWWQPYVNATVAGIIYGVLFAIMDFMVHRRDDVDGKGVEQHLIVNLSRNGLIGLALYAVLSFGFSYWSMNRRYHAYPPEMYWLNLAWPMLSSILWVTLVWVSVKTMRRSDAAS